MTDSVTKVELKDKKILIEAEIGGYGILAHINGLDDGIEANGSAQIELSRKDALNLVNDVLRLVKKMDG